MMAMANPLFCFTVIYILCSSIYVLYTECAMQCAFTSPFSLYISVALPARLSYRFTFADEQHNIFVATIRSTPLADMSVSVCVCRRLFLDRQRITWEWNRKRWRIHSILRMTNEWFFSFDPKQNPKKGSVSLSLNEESKSKNDQFGISSSSHFSCFHCSHGLPFMFTACIHRRQV